MSTITASSSMSKSGINPDWSWRIMHFFRSARIVHIIAYAVRFVQIDLSSTNLLLLRMFYVIVIQMTNHDLFPHQRTPQELPDFSFSPNTTHELTGLPNRRALQEAMNNATQNPHLQGNFALIFADLDGLKGINDSEGHPEGDKYIREAASILHASLRPSDLAVAAHLSGDEFAVLVAGVSDPEQLAVIQSRLQNNLDEIGIPNSMGGKIHELGETPGQLLSAADKLMYQNKIERKIEPLSSEKRADYLELGRIAAERGLDLRDAPAIINELQVRQF